MANQSHESFSRHEIETPGSDRAFGIVMAVAFAVLSLANAWHSGRTWPWTLALAIFFFLFALIRPGALRPLNWVWFRFGLLLHKIVNPLVMAFVYFGTVLPTGLAMRALGKDLLRLKRQQDATSYWIERSPVGPPRESMKDQF